MAGGFPKVPALRAACFARCCTAPLRSLIYHCVHVLLSSHYLSVFPVVHSLVAVAFSSTPAPSLCFLPRKFPGWPWNPAYQHIFFCACCRETSTRYPRVAIVFSRSNYSHEFFSWSLGHPAYTVCIPLPLFPIRGNGPCVSCVGHGHSGTWCVK